MKICIPIKEDHGFDSKPSDHPGTAPFFAIVDVDSNELEVVRNPQCNHAPGSCHHIPVLTAHQVKAIVCQGVGRKAYAALTDAGIEVFLRGKDKIADIVDAVRTGEATSLPEDRVCGGGRGGGHGHDGGGN